MSIRLFFLQADNENFNNERSLFLSPSYRRVNIPCQPIFVFQSRRKSNFNFRNAPVKNCSSFNCKNKEEFRPGIHLFAKFSFPYRLPIIVPMRYKGKKLICSRRETGSRWCFKCFKEATTTTTITTRQQTV